MADLTRYVNTGASSGGDGTTNGLTGATAAYVSLSVAEAGEAADLVAAGDTLTILCSGSTADTTSANFTGGWTTDATHDITINPHPDDVNTTGIYDTGKYRIERSFNYAVCIRIQAGADFATIEGLQISVTGTNGICLRLDGASGCDIKAIGNILQGNSGGSQRGIRWGVSGGNYTLVNNVIYDHGSAGIINLVYMSTGDQIVYNNTLVGNGTGLQIASGSASTTRIFNNISTGNTTDYSITNTPDATDNNISSDATSPDSAHRNITVTYTNAAGKDFSTSDSDVVGLGTDLSADSDYAFSTDIIGEDRGTTWDIGAFQEPAAGGNTITATQTEDGDTQTASIVSLIQISANQAEAGDTTAASIQVPANISANQTEAGDTQAASIVGVVTSEITANQTEVGDTTAANIEVPAQISANQTEAGDSQAASISNVVSISANQTEAGDTQVAAIDATAGNAITANQLEAGDTQSASLSVIIQISANQLEAGDTQVALIDANIEPDIPIAEGVGVNGSFGAGTGVNGSFGNGSASSGSFGNGRAVNGSL